MKNRRPVLGRLAACAARFHRAGGPTRAGDFGPPPWLGAIGGLGLALGVLLTGSSCERAGAEGDAVVTAPAVRPALAGESTIASFEERPIARGLEVIEAAADGRVLAGRRREAPDRSSAKLLFDAELYDERGERVAVRWPTGLQDARFAPPPARTLAVLGADDVLRLYEPPYETARELDRDVFPGFAFSNDGQSIAFARGEAPELYGYRVGLASGERVKLTHHGSPVWGFAFSPDDSRIAFVDSREGYPSLMTTDRSGGTLAKLTNRGLRPGDKLAGVLAPFPDGRRPPIWTTTGLWLEDQSGVHALDAEGRVLLSRRGATELHAGRAPGAVLFREGGRMWRVP